MRTPRLAAVALASALAVAGCSDAADTEVQVPTVDVPETVSPGMGEGGGEGGEGGGEGGGGGGEGGGEGGEGGEGGGY